MPAHYVKKKPEERKKRGPKKYAAAIRRMMDLLPRPCAAVVLTPEGVNLLVPRHDPDEDIPAGSPIHLMTILAMLLTSDTPSVKALRDECFLELDREFERLRKVQ